MSSHLLRNEMLSDSKFKKIQVCSLKTFHSKFSNIFDISFLFKDAKICFSLYNDFVITISRIVMLNARCEYFWSKGLTRKDKKLELLKRYWYTGPADCNTYCIDHNR